MGLERRKWLRVAMTGLALGMGCATLTACDTVIPSLTNQFKEEPVSPNPVEPSAEPTDDGVWVEMSPAETPETTPDVTPTESAAVAATATTAEPSDNAAPGTDIPPIGASSNAPLEMTIPGNGVVIASSLNVRKEPNTQSEVVYGLFANANVKVIEDAGDWYRVRVGEIIGYVKKEFIAPSDGTLKPTQEDIEFYDDVAGAFKTVNKSFYWVMYSGNPRRFDVKLPVECFEYDETGQLRISTYVRDITQNMGKALYNTDTFSVNCYFGQYYPAAQKEDGTSYETGIHEGIDFGGPELDSTFYSLTDGVVTAVQDSKNNQEYAWIAVQTESHTVFYIHHQASYVKAGKTVKRGDRLGKQGDLGAPGASHVHIAVSNGNVTEFARSKDTVLTDDSPYEFWKNQGY